MPNDTTPEPTAAESHGLDHGSSEFAQIDAMIAAEEKSQPGQAPTSPTAAAKSDETPSDFTPDILDDTPAAPPQQPAAEPARGPGRPAKLQRALEGLDEQEAAIFTKMANEGYEKLYPLYKKLKEAGGLDTLLGQKTEFEKQRAELEKARFYDHPDAYKLSPEYAEQQQIVANIDDVDSFWQEQLSLVHEDKPARILVRDAQGRLSVSQETYASSPQLKTRIMSELAAVKADRNEAIAKLGSIRESFKTQYTGYEAEFGRIQKHVFGAVEDKIKDQVKKELELIPAYARHKPEVQFAARALALLRLQIAKNKQAAATASAKTASDQIEKSNGPTAASIATGPSAKARVGTSVSDKELEESIRRVY
jgi:hypothetical protein